LPLLVFLPDRNGACKKRFGFDNFVPEIGIDRGARIVNNAGSVERNNLI
jgi:hypothetical protein